MEFSLQPCDRCPAQHTETRGSSAAGRAAEVGPAGWSPRQLSGAALCLSTSDMEVVTAAIQDCQVIRCNQIKMRSLGWTLLHYDWCPDKKRAMSCKVRDTERSRMCEGGGRGWASAASAKESLERPDAGRTEEGNSPRDFPGGRACRHLDLAPLASRLPGKECLLF